MTTRRMGLISGWLVVIGALVWALQERDVRRAAEAEIATTQSAQQKVRADTDALVARSRRLNARFQAATRQLTTPVVAGVRNGGTGLTPAQREAEFKVRRRAQIELDDQVIRRRVGLSAEDAQKLAQIQENFRERIGDVAQAARDNHVDVTSPQLKPMLDSEETRLEQRIAEEFGPDVAKAIATENNRAAARDAVGQVAADLCFTDHPLSLAQADELEDALAKLQSSTGMFPVAATQLTPNGSVLHMNSPSGLSDMQPLLSQVATLQQLVTAHLTPEQAAIVANRMGAAASYFAIGANAYATWRAIRNGAPAPTTVGLPHE